MGKNNQQRRKAKAKERAKARARARNQEARAGAGGGSGRDPWQHPAGSGDPGASFGFGPAAQPGRPPVGWDAGLTVRWLHRWLLETDAGAVAASDRARSEVLRDIRIPARKATVMTHLTEVLLGAVEQVWTGGWEPVDLLRIARRELPAGGVAITGDIISLSLGRYAQATVAPRWHDQVREHDLSQWWPRSSTPLLERLHDRSDDDGVMAFLGDVMAAASLLGSLPSVQQLEAPPGQWRAAPTTTPGPGATPKMLERVRQLLAKAESTPYEAEAETFTAAAQKLMARHSIDQALLAATRPADRAEAPIARRVGVERPYEAPKVALANAVAEANRCRVVWSKAFGFVTVVGYAQDVAATETLLTSLLLQGTRAMTAQGSRRTPWGHSRTRAFRQSFLLAYASRIGQRLQEATQQEVDAHQEEHGRAGGAGTTAGPGTELVAVLEARAEKVQEATDSLFGDLQATGLGSARDGEGWTAGTHAADAAHLAGEPADTLTG